MNIGNSLSNNKGFSLTELIIAIIVVAILSIVSVNIYRALLMRSVSTEGKTLASMILKAEKLYWVEYGRFYGGDLSDIEISSDSVLGIDARANKYFRTFEINLADESNLHVVSKAPVPYEGLELRLTVDGMSQEKDTKPFIRLYDTKHSETETIEVEL